MNDRASAAMAMPQLRLPDVQMNLCTPKAPGVAKVVRTEPCTASTKSAAWVRHIEFDVSGTPLAGAFRPGQSFGIVPPGVDEKGKPNKVRLYSIASPTHGEDGQGNVISSPIKRVIDEHWTTHRLFEGVASNYLCDLQVGDEVKVTGPVGRRYLLPVNATDFNYIFFATGTGIAPFRGMSLDLLQAGATRPIWTIMGSPYATDLLYHDLFLRLGHQHPNFHYLTAISREPQEDRHDQMYVDGRIETHLDELLPLLTEDRTLIYICGITGMEVGIFQQLARHLRGATLERYLQIDPDALAHAESWTHRMINREIRPTERVFLEVYA